MMALTFSAVLSSAFLTLGSAQVFDYQPPELVSENGALEVTLNVGLVDSLPGIEWSTTGFRTAPGYNGQGVGPTLRVKPGDSLKVTLNNNLPPSSDIDRELHDYVVDTTSDDVNTTIIYNRLAPNGNVYAPQFGFWGLNFVNLHFHGLHFPTDEEDVFNYVDGGESKTYNFKIDEDMEPGTYWYHDHVHGKASYAYLSGLMGFVIVEGTEDDLTEAPGIKGSREILMMLSEGLVKPDGTVPPFFPIVMEFNYTGVTNGQISDDTIYKVNQGETVHFRVTSATVEPTYRLSINNTKLVLVGADAFPQAKPQEVDVVAVSGGGRRDFLARFDEPGTYVMTRAAWAPFPRTVEFCEANFGISVYPCCSYDVQKVVAYIEVSEVPDYVIERSFVSGEGLVDSVELPPSMNERTEALSQQESVDEKTIVFEQQSSHPLFQIPAGLPEAEPWSGILVGFGVNDRLLTPSYRAGTVTAGTCETWNVISIPPFAEHSFHSHSSNFMVTHQNGVELEQPFWRDTVMLEINATIHICFDRVTSEDSIFVHCHAPSHLDIGMATTFDVVEPENKDPDDIDPEDTSLATNTIPTSHYWMMTASFLLVMFRQK